MEESDFVRRLREHLVEANWQSGRSTEVIEVMRWVRLILENEQLGTTYPPLKLYCDWALHTEIDRSRLAIKMLEQMNAALTNDVNQHDYNVAVSRMLSLSTLRAEMVVLFTSHKIPTYLVNSFTNWSFFLGELLNDLCERPIRLPQKPKGKLKREVDQAIERMRQKWRQKDPWARSFHLTMDRTQTPSPFLWTLEYAAPGLTGADSFEVKGGLMMAETPQAFARE